MYLQILFTNVQCTSGGPRGYPYLERGGSPNLCTARFPRGGWYSGVSSHYTTGRPQGLPLNWVMEGAQGGGEEVGKKGSWGKENKEGGSQKRSLLCNTCKFISVEGKKLFEKSGRVTYLLLC